MAENEPKGLDVFGMRPVAEAVSHATKAAIDGASAFLARICLPAAEEFGLLLQDKVRAWRARNAVAVVSEAQVRYERYQKDPKGHAHPRLVVAALEYGSWSDDRTMQQMWGGLLASSCSPDGRDESNLIFINLLSQLTGLQVRVIDHACENVKKGVSGPGLITPEVRLIVTVPTIKTIASTDDLHRLDRELDNLRSLGLIYGGFDLLRPGDVDITPTSLGLNLYVRCQGFAGSAVEFFGLDAKSKNV